MLRTATWLGLAAFVAAGGLMTFGFDRVYAQAFVQAPAKSEATPKIPAALPRDVAFGRFIALIRGHLLTGEELVKQRDWSDAHPHFLFPLEEIYGVIREDLRAYKTPPFDGALKALARTVQARNAKQYPKALENVQGALAAADAELKTRQPDWPRFELTVATEVMKTALEEYEDAIANGRIARPVGYRTARGFILQADRMIESVAPDLEAKNAETLRDIRDGLSQLKQTFAPMDAPKQVVLDYSDALKIMARIELAAAKFN